MKEGDKRNAGRRANKEGAITTLRVPLPLSLSLPPAGKKRTRQTKQANLGRITRAAGGFSVGKRVILPKFAANFRKSLNKSNRGPLGR